MKILVTGSAGHLGEALVRTLQPLKHEVVGLDILASPFTTARGSICDRGFVRRWMLGVNLVFHCATLHKPHLVTHAPQEFIDVNVTGTLNLLAEAVTASVDCFVFTSTTSVFGDALLPPSAAPAVWVTENIAPVPKNIYGISKAAAESLCRLFHHDHGLPCIVLRTSRFFPEHDDNKGMRENYSVENLKANEYLFRRVDIEDAVNAHLLAAERGPSIGFEIYIISATTPFQPDDLVELRTNAPAVVRRRVPAFEEEYWGRGWKMFPSIGRVYVNSGARKALDWRPKYDFQYVIDRLKAEDDLRSPLARLIGSKGYHAQVFADGPYPVKPA